MSMDGLARMAVTPFPTSASRPRLLTALEAMVSRVATCVPICDIWIDGSFVTEKPEPDDVDLTLMVEGAAFDMLDTAVQMDLLNFQDGRFGPALHVFVVITREKGHPGYALSQQLVDYWSRWWAVSRENWIKGIPVIRLGETDVGLRVLS
jgi:hypothetical protein